MSTTDIEDCRDLYNAVRQVVRRLPHHSPFRLLVTGSRTWTDQTVVSAVQYAIAAEVDGPVHQTDGACDSGGLDTIAFILAAFEMHRRGWTIHREPAQWFDGWRESGRNPGHERNQKMVDIGHDLCVGFPDPNRSPGTWDCLGRAYAAGIPAYAVVKKHGRWTLERFVPRGTHPNQSTLDFTS